MSIIQHFGCETPLLDWTRKPNVALYFATLSQLKYQKKDPIDEYFSIYLINKEHPYYNFNSKTGYDFFISKNLKIILKRLRIFKRIKFTKIEINDYFNDDKNILNSIYKFPIQRIDDDKREFINHYTKSNYNITAHDGLFILNADPYKPLEESILNRILDLANKPHPVSVSIENAIQENLNNFFCYDIHKKFIPKIINALNSGTINITKDTMFPDFKKLKEEITFEKITENIRYEK